MAVFGFGKKDDKPEGSNPPPTTPTTPPTDKILAMRQQGLSNNQIIQNLQNMGYDSNQIFDSLNQADIKAGVESMPPTNDFKPDELQNPMQYPAQDPQPPFPEGPQPLASSARSMPQQGPPPMDLAQDMGMQIDPSSMERIEEIAEAIIDEKWNEIVKSVNKIIDWKDRTETKIIKIEQQLVDMKQDFDNLTKGVLGKIGEYDENLTNIGTEIKAMEKVFQKVLPQLTENVNTLDRLTKDIKKGKK